MSAPSSYNELAVYNNGRADPIFSRIHNLIFFMSACALFRLMVEGDTS